jgi:large subunit ribosomal protein L4
VSTITTSAADYTPVTPFHEQNVTATIHQFPSLEPLRFETFPANHLYLPTRRDILHRAVVYEGDATRLGTASTLTRYEVHGSRRKIRPQKGSGRARLGDKKSPMLRGGGVAFGPKPRDFSTELPKKVYDLAWRTALSYRFRKNELIIVDNAMELESPSARLLEDIFKYHEKIRGRGRNLMVTLEERPLLEDALDQLGRGEQTLTWEEVDVKDLLSLSGIMIERAALNNILRAHQEDLTNKAHNPWHKSFARPSPPTDLQSIIGWEEFKDLQLLDPEARETARPTAYEDVAHKRYTHATSLPPGPQRTELTISAYTLLAEAKGLYFEKCTGFPYAKYAGIVRYKIQTNPAKRAKRFPRIQALEYQRDILISRAEEAAQVSRLESDELELQAYALDLEIAEIKHTAATLAAQVNEHEAEVKQMVGDTKEYKTLIRLAGKERVTVEQMEIEMVDVKLEMARMESRVCALKGDAEGQMRAQEEVEKLQAQKDAMNPVEEEDVEEEVEKELLDEVEKEMVEGAKEKELVDEAVKREEKK